MLAFFAAHVIHEYPPCDVTDTCMPHWLFVVIAIGFAASILYILAIDKNIIK